MELLTINLAANETKLFRRAGSYIEILSSTGAVGLTLYSTLGGQIGSITGGLSGLFLTADYGAFDLRDQTGAAQTVQLLVCDAGESGGSRRQPGQVTILDTISANVQTQVGSNTAVTAFSAQQIVAPAANLNGVIVRSATAEVKANVTAGSAEGQLIASPTVPTAMTGLQTIMIVRAADFDGKAFASASFDLRKRIPAGWGLYHCTVNATGAAVRNACYCAFEVL